MKALDVPKKFNSLDEVIQFILKDAEEKSWWIYLRSDLRSGDPTHPSVLKDNAENVGKIVEALPPEAREMLKDLSSEDLMKKMFYGWKEHQARPKYPVRERVRGPVSFGNIERGSNND